MEKKKKMFKYFSKNINTFKKIRIHPSSQIKFLKERNYCDQKVEGDEMQLPSKKSLKNWNNTKYMNNKLIENNINKSMKSKDWKSVVKSLLILKENSQLTTHQLNTLIGVSIKLKDRYMLDKYVKEIIFEQGIEVHLSTLFSLFSYLKGISKDENFFNLSERLFEHSLKRLEDEELKFKLYRSMVMICLESNHQERGRELIEEMNQLFPQRATETNLMMLEVDFVEGTSLESILPSYFTPNFEDLAKKYSLLITISSKNSKYKEATNIYEKMKEENFTPSKQAFIELIEIYMIQRNDKIQHLIEHLFNSFEGEELIQIMIQSLKKLKKKDFFLFKTFFNSILLEHFDHLCDYNYSPLFLHLLQFSFEKGKLDESVKELTFFFGAKKIKMHINICNKILELYYSDKNSISKAEIFLKYMRKEKIKFDSLTFSILSQHYQTQKRYKEALDYANESINILQSQQDTQRETSDQEKILSNLILCYLQQNDEKNSLKAFEICKERKVKISFQAIKEFVLFYCQKKQFPKAYFFFRYLSYHLNYSPDQQIVNQILMICPFNRMISFYQMSLKYCYISRNIFSYSVLIQRAAKEQRFDICLRFFEETKLFCTPDFMVYELVLCCALITGKLSHFSSFYHHFFSFLPPHEKNQLLWAEIFLGEHQLFLSLKGSLSRDRFVSLLNENYSFLFRLLSQTNQLVIFFFILIFLFY